MEFHFPQVFEAIAAAIPDREAVVFRERRLSYAQLRDRSRQLAQVLLRHGLGDVGERSGLAGHESGQAHLALYLHNGNEYLESMLGAFMGRLAPLNVNYRYVDEELLYLFQNSRAKVLVYHAEFAPRVAALRERLPELELLIQVDDDSDNPLLPGALAYEDALAAEAAELPDVAHSPDDLYILYTGGTTGMPKGVLWRSADIYMAAMGGRRADGHLAASLEDVAENAAGGLAIKALVGPPLMHGAAQWGAFINLGMGSTLLFTNEVKRFDAAQALDLIEREKALSLTIVGDAFAQPLLDELRKGGRDLSSLFVIASGGAPLSEKSKAAMIELLPHITVMDGLGSSETGVQASNPSNKDTGVSSGRFQPAPGACVVSEDMTRVLPPGDQEMGWLAQQGRVPLGYLGDAEKTAKTFPVIDGVRYSVPGDRAHYKDDGVIEVLGRDSVTISSGGEKIFAEEVETAVKQHPDVYDAVVAGRPSERWGHEVVAVVQLREGATATEGDLIAEAGKHVARYKLPKAVIFRDRIQRSPSGKADYRWAKEQATAGART
ncbi:MAG: acyl-CoA synthetase [Deltaproteobacteria bacterium]|nr:acyl-CoA synthetase [Deltaproteobacteria bacterium]MBW2360540.1 acyl-CoA synthetase [Deltaproteobacteria bacterium]